MTDVPVGGGSHPAAAEPSLHRVMGPWLLLLFIVGDILGTGIYALTGQVAKQVGGVVWLPFLVAFVVAADHRVQLPRAGHQISARRRRRALHAQGLRHPLRHLHRRLRGDVLGHHLGVDGLARLRGQPVGRVSTSDSTGLGITVIGLLFMAVVAVVNFRGVGESVKANVVLTCVELTGLLIIIFIGLWAIGAGRATSRASLQFKTCARRRHVLAGDRGDHARLLRHGGLRGFGQHGRGMQGSDPHFPEGAARRAGHHRR